MAFLQLNEVYHYFLFLYLVWILLFACLCLSKLRTKIRKMLFCGFLDQELTVIKRDGRTESFQRSKVAARLRRLDLIIYSRKYVSLGRIMIELDKEVSKCIVVESTYIDDFLGKTAAKLNTEHPDYLYLAKQIAITKLYKETSDSFSETMDQLYKQKRSGIADKDTPQLSESFHTAVVNNAKRLDGAIQHKRDLSLSYFTFKLLEAEYLFRLNGKVVERPQYMFMRVSLALNNDDIEAALESYELMSLRYFTHSTATLISAGTVKAQMCSNYGIVLPSDPEGVFECLNQCSEISKKMGDVAIYCHDYPSKYSKKFSGLPKVFTLFHDTYVNNIRTYGNKIGQFTFYVEVWHADICDILSLIIRSPEVISGLKICVIVPEQFMERLRDEKTWSVMCPSNAPGLGNLVGDKFKEVYCKYEGQGRVVAATSATTIWAYILHAQIGSQGLPTVVFKEPYSDTLMQLGTFKCDTSKSKHPFYFLTSSKDMSVYPSAFIAMNRLLDMKSLKFSLDIVQRVANIVTRNLDKLIDINFYPVVKAKVAAVRNRSIAIGVHGFATVAQCSRNSYDSAIMEIVCCKFFEMLHFFAANTSRHLAKAYGRYKNFKNIRFTSDFLDSMAIAESSFLSMWEHLASDVEEYGLRNSTFLTVEPSPEVAQLLDTSNSVEPFLSNLSVLELNAEKFIVINEKLIESLVLLGQWNDDIRSLIMTNQGSILGIPNLPDAIKEAFRTAWEVDPFFTQNVADQIQTFIDHHQAVYCYVSNNITLGYTSGCQYQAYSNGLKSGFCRIVQKADLHYPVLSIGKQYSNKTEGTELLHINMSILFLKHKDIEDIKKQLVAKIKH